MPRFTIETGGSNETLCDCCGQRSRSVSGFVYDGDHAVAAYIIQWTVDAVDSHGANFDLIIGKWGEGTSADDRSAVSLAFCRSGQAPSFTVIDASSRPAGRSELVHRALAREEVIGTPLAKNAFEMVDAVWLQDGRIGGITGAG